jgi:protein gp37
VGKDSAIQWTHHTFNPWWGCWKVSPACEHCYAWAFDARLGGGHWQRTGPRRFFGDKHWRQPINWDAVAAKAGERHRVFCASMSDVFEDRDDLKGHRWRLLNLIQETPNLDWLLLTKRPESVSKALLDYELFLEGFDETPSELAWIRAWRGGDPPANVWLGTTVEDQEYADRRIPELLKIPAAVRFLSVEPMLASIDLREFVGYPKYRGNVAGQCVDIDGCTWHKDGDKCRDCGWGYPNDPDWPGRVPGIAWVIVGGESGLRARPFDLGWARSAVRQCRQAGVSAFVKQLGARPIESEPDDGPEWPVPLEHDNSGNVVPMLRDSHGGDWDEWPEDLRVREFPRTEVAHV